jgi:DNA gyrase subunit B
MDIGIDIGGEEREEAVKKIRYGKIIIMSVDAQEHVFVRDQRGVRMTTIGAFIDAALAEHAQGRDRLTGAQVGEVMCFGLGDHQVRFRPIKALIRHPLEEALYEVRTAYGRSVRVTASHSVFVHEDGEVVLKRGDELKGFLLNLVCKYASRIWTPGIWPGSRRPTVCTFPSKTPMKLPLLVSST